MKKAFGEYQQPNKLELKKIWANSLIVLDTNVLLDFYCFGNKTIEDYYKVLEAIKSSDQLWMPYHVGYEFFENRVGIISKQLKQYENIVAYIDGTKEKILGLKNNSTSHSMLDFESIADQYEKATSTIKGKVETLKSKHPDYLDNDTIVNALQKIYTDDIVGTPFTAEQVVDIEKEGATRYQKNIPPGYRDQKKEDDQGGRYVERKYGDLVIWKQMIQKAKDTNKSIIFVTNDAKEDWIQYAAGSRKIGPKPALKKELFDEAGVNFCLNSSDEFLEYAHNHFSISVDEKSVQEVKKYRELELERSSSIAHSNGEMTYGVARRYSFTRRVERQLISAEEILRQLASGEVPQRALLTMTEVLYRYRKILGNYDDDAVTESVVEGVYTVDKLLKRLMHILESSDESHIMAVQMLKSQNSRLLNRMIHREPSQPSFFDETS